jgi:hypothetical protein
MEWQPIETAPRDGVIMGFKFGKYMEPVYCVSWVEKRDRYWRSVRGDRVEAPTHWMPLPPLPSKENE